MAAKKKTPAKKRPVAKRRAPANAVPRGPDRVIVEMLAPIDGPAAVFRAAAPLDAAGFQLDGSFDPIPVEGDLETAASLEANHQRTVLVRGTVDSAARSTLESQADVVGVWTDAPIAPFDAVEPDKLFGFDFEPGLEENDFAQTVEQSAFGTCPIPPCDCTPETAKGDIPAVAQYLGVDKIWAAGKKGQGIVVGVVDGGITTPSRVTGGRIGRVIGGPKTNWGQKAFWGQHGEMVATDVLGMAPDARLYDIRLPDSSLDPLGAVISDALAGFQWAITRHRDNGTPQILTNSWGVFRKSWDPAYATDPNHPFTRKVVEAVGEGIIVLFAAGNCGETCPSSKCGTVDTGPGKSIWGANGHPLVMTVGAANIKEQLIGYSSQGPAALSPHKPDFCSISHFKGYFSSDTGTSAACPIAAGVVALLKQCKSDLSPAAAKAVLKSTAKNLGTAGWDAHSGSGIIQAWEAYKKTCGGSPISCVDERRKALLCWRAYQKTQNTRFLCCFYYWAALYFRCLFIEQHSRHALCSFYAYGARYFACLFRVTGNARYRDLQRAYERSYLRCRRGL